MTPTTQKRFPLALPAVQEKPRLNLSQIQSAIVGQRGKIVEIQEVSREKEAILSALRDGIIGQDKPCNQISDVIDTGLNRAIYKKGPLGVVFLAGPTGVGKTETVRVLAEKLLGNPNAFTKINCEQFQESHTSRTLFEAPPSYVGYGDVSPLRGKNVYKPFESAKKTKKLHPIIAGKRDFGIILFDEIEKAHPQIRQSLLSLLDDGKIDFASGNTTNYENVLVVMTSNVGEKEVAQQKGKNPIGFGSPSEESKNSDEQDTFRNALEEKFSPEFLGRVGTPIRFNSISREDSHNIVRKHIEALNNSMGEYFSSWNIHIGLSEEAIGFIVEKGFNSKEGARPLTRLIEKYISNPVNRTLREYANENFLSRKSPTILFYELNEDKEGLSSRFYTPDIVPEESIIDSYNAIDTTTTTVDLVSKVLGTGKKFKSICIDFAEDGFSEEEVQILVHLNEEYTLTTIFEAENGLYDEINLLDGMEEFLPKSMSPRLIKSMAHGLAKRLNTKEDYSKHIFILTLIVKSIQVVEKLLNESQLTNKQENIVVRLAVTSAVKVF